MKKNTRILIYGDIDLNFIDGSAIWLTSIAQMFNKTQMFTVDLLLKAPKRKKSLYSEIEGLGNVNLINPYQEFSDYKYESRVRLTTKDAVSIMELLDSRIEYDCVIVRGMSLTQKLLGSYLHNKTLPYITEYDHHLESFKKNQGKLITTIYNSFPKLFIQTPQAIEYLKKALQVDGKKFSLMTPMIPDYLEKPSFKNKNNSIVYTGKFAKDWYIEELLNGFEKIISEDNSIYLNVAGNKFQGELTDHKERLSNKLSTQENLNWFGAVTREQSLHLINDSDVGYSWRSKDIDNDQSLELSTKVLEYGSMGKPILLRRNVIHESLFGKDYELFIDTEEEFVYKTIEVLNNQDLYRKVAKKVYNACEKFTYNECAKRVSSTIWDFTNRKTNLLFAGHDLKFAKEIIEHFKNKEQYNVKIDQWKGHTNHDELQSKKHLEWADIIFCEWGLGNAVWYSNNKLPGQKLIVRMHQQERFTEYPKLFNLEKIDNIITVSPYFFEEFHRLFQLPKSKLKMIYNYVNCEKFAKVPKKDYNQIKYNLGICGVLPKMKRLDLALKIFEELWNQDNKYKIFIKSKRPEQLSWLMRREDEKKYYENIYEKINNSPWKNNVIFDEHGDDMDQWFSKIGYILSTSDFESFHLAPMEGMASGSYPIVRNWAGAETIYNESNIFDSVRSMVEFIRKEPLTSEMSNELKRYPKSNFDLPIILKQYEQLIECL